MKKIGKFVYVYIAKPRHIDRKRWTDCRAGL